MSDTKIEWADKSWNPISGCTKCSPGCDNCYAEKMSHRIKHICAATNNNPQYLGKTDDSGHWTGEIECCNWLLEQPSHWKKPSRIFVCSMSDLFHPKVPDSFIEEVFDVIRKTQQHKYLILTKRVKRMRDFENERNRNKRKMRDIALALLLGYDPIYFEHIQWGVSISNQSEADEKIPILLKIPADVRWLSIEPMLGPIDFKRVPIKKWWFPPMTVEQAFRNEHFAYRKVEGVIVGGESGPGARPMHPDWVRSIRDQCVAANVPFFFKQWGAWLPASQMSKEQSEVNKLSFWPKRVTKIKNETFFRFGKKKAGRLLDGREWNEYPKRR